MFKKLIQDVLAESEYADELETNIDPVATEDLPEEEETEAEETEKPAEEEEVDPEIEEEIDDREPMTTARVFSFDKVKINDELKELCKDIVTEFPHIQIKEILSKYDLVFVKNNAEFEEDDGDIDYELSTTDGKAITNTALVTQHHKREEGNGFNFNMYLQ